MAVPRIIETYHFDPEAWLARGEAMGYRVEATTEPRRGLYVQEPEQPLPDEDMEWHRQRREHHRELFEWLAARQKQHNEVMHG